MPELRCQLPQLWAMRYSEPPPKTHTLLKHICSPAFGHPPRQLDSDLLPLSPGLLLLACRCHFSFFLISQSHTPTVLHSITTKPRYQLTSSPPSSDAISLLYTIPPQAGYCISFVGYYYCGPYYNTSKTPLMQNSKMKELPTDAKGLFQMALVLTPARE